MNKEKLEYLKRSIKLTRLAEFAGLKHPVELHRIIKRTQATDYQTARKLADLANKMSLRVNYYTADDFYYKEEE